MIRLLQTRRGLSTIVTTAIMLTAVAVIGSTLVAWSNSKLTTFETGLASSAADKTNKINENLSIENVWFYTINGAPPSHYSVNIALTNIGNEGLSVTDIKMVSASQTFDYPQNNISILTGKSNSFLLSLWWQSKVPVTIYVTTTRGLIYTTQAVPP